MKTRRYESPVAPARQTAPRAPEVEAIAPAKVQQLEAGERGAGQRLDNFLARILKDVPKTHIFRVIRKGEVRVNGKRAKPDQRLLASDIVRVPPVRTGAAAPRADRLRGWPRRVRSRLCPAERSDRSSAPRRRTSPQ